jgi:glycine/D-amino acid oxidase-like deaminating enzyme
VSGPRPDVIVVGGGIVGTSAAAFLAAAGARVTLVEREGLASGASGANSGVVQHPFDPVLVALYRESIERYRELTAGEVGFRLPAAPAGMLFVSADGRAVRDQAATLTEMFPQLDVEVVTGLALATLEPAVARGLWACRVGIGYPVPPGAATYAYASLAERHRAQLLMGRSATLDLRGDEVVGVVVDGRRLSAGAVLVAAGPWSPELIDLTGRWRPIRRRWGVVVEIELPAGPRHVLEDAEIGDAIGVAPDATVDPAGAGGRTAAVDPATGGGRMAGDIAQAGDSMDFSLVPLAGVATVGSTFLAQEPDPADWLERLLLAASTFVPAVAEAPIRGARACARPQSADGRPLVGQVPGRHRLFVCAGHGPWGISTGPASARLVADMILGRDAGIPGELDPSRFGSPAGEKVG